MKFESSFESPRDFAIAIILRAPIGNNREHVYENLSRSVFHDIYQLYLYLKRYSDDPFSDIIRDLFVCIGDELMHRVRLLRPMQIYRILPNAVRVYLCRSRWVPVSLFTRAFAICTQSLRKKTRPLWCNRSRDCTAVRILLFFILFFSRGESECRRGNETVYLNNNNYNNNNIIRRIIVAKNIIIYACTINYSLLLVLFAQCYQRT